MENQSNVFQTITKHAFALTMVLPWELIPSELKFITTAAKRQTGTHWKNLKAFTVNPREENKSFKSSSLTEELREQGETHKEVLEHEKESMNLCFRTWKLLSRNVGEVQSGWWREDVVEVFRAGFFEAVEGGAWEVPRQHLLLLARPSPRQLHDWMFGQHHSYHVAMETLAVQMTHRWWGKGFEKGHRKLLIKILQQQILCFKEFVSKCLTKLGLSSIAHLNKGIFLLVEEDFHSLDVPINTWKDMQPHSNAEDSGWVLSLTARYTNDSHQTRWRGIEARRSAETKVVNNVPFMWCPSRLVCVWPLTSGFRLDTSSTEWIAGGAICRETRGGDISEPGTAATDRPGDKATPFVTKIF